MDYQKALNPAQFEAVTATTGPILVIAGAGSGKTRTLVYRLAYLVEQGVPPWNILLLTFTRKASQEMLHRASELIHRPLHQVSGGTFHAVCHGWLRSYGARIGYDTGFTLLDRHDQGDLVRLLRDRLEIKVSPGQFPRRQTIVDIFSAVVNKDLPLDFLVTRDYPQFVDQTGTLETLGDLYREHKREHHLLDYDDLLLEGRRLLTEHEDLRLFLSQRYQYIMVDEYQDTNRLQAELVRLLAGTHDNVMVVGDDSQSIYSFRGAHFRNIMDFPRLFPGARIIKLEENYRSTQPILDLTNTIIAQASEKYTKCLFTRKKEGPRPVLLQAGSENEQSRLVCQVIGELQDQGTSLRQVAVLFRSAYHSFDLEIELLRQHLPFMKFGGFKFMESAHIKDLLAHLRVAANPRDSISWNRLLQLAPGIGKKTAQKFLARLNQEEFSLDHALAWLGSQKSARARAGVAPLADLLQELQNPDLSPATRLNLALSYYEPIVKTHFDDYPKRLRDLEHLLTITARYRALGDFLNDLTLEPPASMADLTADPGEYLTLSTIHSAKGLEWDAVIIIWAAEGRFPSAYSLEREEELEEERRLMYVAATRARRYLYLTYPTVSYNRYLGTTFNTASRFVRDLPASLLESLKVTPGW
ncbi:MAG: ATP-dependent helicase [Deltaproteobacteria bacterium]|nr:ATP-dependent helicase [Deltaproteobacteria bacterium]